MGSPARVMGLSGLGSGFRKLEPGPKAQVWPLHSCPPTLGSCTTSFGPHPLTQLLHGSCATLSLVHPVPPLCATCALGCCITSQPSCHQSWPSCHASWHRRHPSASSCVDCPTALIQCTPCGPYASHLPLQHSSLQTHAPHPTITLCPPTNVPRSPQRCPGPRQQGSCTP